MGEFGFNIQALSPPTFLHFSDERHLKQSCESLVRIEFMGIDEKYGCLTLLDHSYVSITFRHITIKKLEMEMSKLRKNLLPGGKVTFRVQ